MNVFELDSSKLKFNKELVYVTKEQLPQKVVAICQSVKDLYNQGTPFSKMTISEIARLAKIGKGTIYEYFFSKEEIIITAMLLELKTELSNVCNAVLIKNSFQEKYDTSLYWIKERVQTNILLRQMMLACYSHNSDEEICKLIKQIISFTEVNEAFDSIIKAGVQEGLFQSPLNKLQEKSAFATLIIGVTALLKPEEYGNSSLQDTMNYCKALFVQILQGIPTLQ